MLADAYSTFIAPTLVGLIAVFVIHYGIGFLVSSFAENEEERYALQEAYRKIAFRIKDFLVVWGVGTLIRIFVGQ